MTYVTIAEQPNGAGTAKILVTRNARTGDTDQFDFYFSGPGCVGAMYFQGSAVPIGTILRAGTGLYRVTTNTLGTYMVQSSLHLGSSCNTVSMQGQLSGVVPTQYIGPGRRFLAPLEISLP